MGHIVKATRLHSRLNDEEYNEVGEQNEDFINDPEDTYLSLIEEYGSDAEDFFGTYEDFLAMVAEFEADGEMTESEATNELLGMFAEYLEDPEGFMAELESGEEFAETGE